MSNQNKNCSLHGHLFEYFCEKCYEPVCRQCTIIGPHNTPIHSITNLASAYERRVHEIKQRIAAFLENKSTIVESIETLNGEIEQLKLLKDVSLDENERYRSKMLQELQKHEERIRNQIALISEEFQVRVNTVNDLGHTFEILTDDIEIISSHSNVLQSIKECLDRLSILLEQKHTFAELPKELSDLRLDLKNIETYQELIEQKIKIIKEMFDLMNAEKSKIEKPNIDFDVLLRQLSSNIVTCIEHHICHFCGVIFTFNSSNTSCPKNNTALDINEFVGFCQQKPDSVRWATHRHFFGQAANKYANYRTTQFNSFSIHLKALLLKLKTICLIKKINLKQHLESADKTKSGVCNRIEMMYILMQVCGLTAEESEIILTLCDEPVKLTYSYGAILERLKKISIDASEKNMDQEMGMGMIAALMRECN